MDKMATVTRRHNCQSQAKPTMNEFGFLVHCWYDWKKHIYIYIYIIGLLETVAILRIKSFRIKRDIINVCKYI